VTKIKEESIVPPKLKAFIINTLRRASYRWKNRGEAKKRYKVKVGEFKTGRAKYGYSCAKCKLVFKSGEVQMDHLYAVVDPIKGFVGFDEYILRMFCDEENFICLCSGCHDEKTAVEREYRKKFKDLEDDDLELELEYLSFIDSYKEKA